MVYCSTCVEKTPETVKKTLFCGFLYIIYFAHTTQCYLFTIFFILFIFNALHVFSCCNIMIFSTLIYLHIFIPVILLKKYQFSPLFIRFVPSFLHILKKNCIFILFCFNTLQRVNIF